MICDECGQRIFLHSRYNLGRFEAEFVLFGLHFAELYILFEPVVEIARVLIRMPYPKLPKTL
jgi:hypothetical protein